MAKGISYHTKTNDWYDNGGQLELEITEKWRPAETPNWVNFEQAIGADLYHGFKKCFCFPIFTNKIVTFDWDISYSLHSQILSEDWKYFAPEESRMYDTGKSIEHWIKLYWKSMMTLEQYLQKKPYPEPQILIFECVPKEIIRLYEK